MLVTGKKKEKKEKNKKSPKDAKRNPRFFFSVLRPVGR